MENFTPLSAASAGWTVIIAAGLLVGFGTRLGGGCASGHGICGVACLSSRSIAATVIFALAAIMTVAVTRHVLGGLSDADDRILAMRIDIRRGSAVSGMVQPAKVLGFLDIFGAWDPSLAVVMVAALAVSTPGFMAGGVALHDRWQKPRQQLRNEAAVADG